jgi:hypothetical protein
MLGWKTRSAITKSQLADAKVLGVPRAAEYKLRHVLQVRAAVNRI